MASVYTKVYMVTCGEHEQYMVAAIFSTRELAEQYTSVRGRRHYEIEECELDPVESEAI